MLRSVPREEGRMADASMTSAQIFVIDSAPSNLVLVLSILRQALELTLGIKATRGGSSDTEVNELTVIPAAAPSSAAAVITTTPVGS